ncbi:unnamed protein product [Lepeophtheirus salmonis]|uniref:(salmon louse) hypothetical protein n=1 Tax=Lepeophtheirus salmonis TaxID=72036 RepID=A0A7R8H2G8_LEPSM|nr:unnamed protein product [Lepeophtheirus salmonis]CAF2828315.1 unnamed protein product [Lepeophtheirus salmonis]
MASFLIGKSLKDRRQIKAIEELFNKADKNGNGKIFVSDYIHIFTDHGIELKEEEIEKVSGLANEDGEIVRDEFISYAKNSDFLNLKWTKTMQTLSYRNKRP